MKEPKFLYGKTAKSIILSSDVKSYPMANVYAELSKKTGLDFEATILLMQHLPIFLDGNQHKQKRKKLAEIYAETRHLQHLNVAECVERIAHNLTDRNGEVELLSELALPVWQAVQSAIVTKFRFKIDQDLIYDIPNLFDPKLSIRKRIEINARISSQIKDLSIDGRDSFLDALALLVLGIRPLTHSIALSIYKISELNNGVHLSRVNFPQSFGASSLTFVDRISKCPLIIDNAFYGEFERFRCITTHQTYSDHENQTNLFGFGSHLCIGRPISLEIWSLLTASLSKLPKILSKGRIVLRESEPFIVVREARIHLNDA